MNNITVIGIDLAKNVFQVHVEDKWGNKVLITNNLLLAGAY